MSNDVSYFYNGGGRGGWVSFYHLPKKQFYQLAYDVREYYKSNFFFILKISVN